MSSPHRRTPEQLRESMRLSANKARDVADEMARWDGGCDDPMHPFVGDDNIPFHSWIEFVDMVCRPLVEVEDDDKVEQEAMALYRKVPPYFIAAALVMALNRVNALEMP